MCSTTTVNITLIESTNLCITGVQVLEVTLPSMLTADSALSLVILFLGALVLEGPFLTTVD